MAQEKLDQLEQLNSVDTLQTILTTILKETNLTDIIINENSIEGKIASPITGPQNCLFLLLTDHLSRNYSGYDQIRDLINRKLRSKSFNSIIIISSKNITNGFKDRLKREYLNLGIDFWDKNDLVKKIDDYYSDYWRHNDKNLVAYEKFFENDMKDDWSIKKVKEFKAAHEKLLEIFIEPRLMHKVSDFESQKKAFVKISMDKLIDITNPVILEGEPGIGKTRLLKKIGSVFIQMNNTINGKKYLPVFINNINLIENKLNNLLNIKNAVETILKDYFKESTLDELLNQYNFVFLIDSLDDFSKIHQESILKGLKEIVFNGSKIILATRFQEYSTINGITEIGKCEEIFVEKFNDYQIKTFLSLYFKNEKFKAQNLIESLKENSIIQRLPITPLNLSLISILYEENNFEIPATITDIYDNFNNLLLGRSLPDARIEFFDVNFRERILSVYALELLDREERNYMTLKEFKDFFTAFFDPVKTTIDIKQLPNALDFIVNNTGILVLQDGRYVKFLHESYMEYYASREIFFHKRHLEDKLINNFLDINWQYTAVFYAGRSKDMSVFLRKIIERTQKSKQTTDHYRSITGLGNILQALYMTDDSIRKDGILIALNHVLEIYEWMKKASMDEKMFFKALTLPLTLIINTMFFYDNYNSITLRGPLTGAYENLLPFLEISDKDEHGIIDSSIAFKLFTLAITLSSPRINDQSKIDHLVYNTNILNDPLFEKLLDFGISIAGSKELYELKENLKTPNRISKGESKNNIKINKSATTQYLSTPVGRLKFGNYDRISSDRENLIITEGKSDAQIIEHAFTILTDEIPYWEIEPVHEENGGANELAKCLSNGALLSKKKCIIGIFDNDEKGIQEFNGELKFSKFDFFKNSKRVKKHKEAEIYGLKLPIYPEREKYYNKDQKFNFFSIEHYFPDYLLKENNMLEETPIDGIFKISDKNSKKADFSKKIRQMDDPKIFQNFLYLFKEIDEIFGVEINYKEQ